MQAAIKLPKGKRIELHPLNTTANKTPNHVSHRIYKYYPPGNINSK